MRNALVFGWLSLAVLTATAGAQQTTIVPQVRTKPTADNKITSIELAAHFVTAIRVPEPVNSVVVGDPALFQVEHSEHEPELVFVKALTNEHAESNLLISTREDARSAFSWLAVAKARTRRRLISCCDTSHPAAFWSSPTPFLSRSLRRPPAYRRRRLQWFRQLRVPRQRELPCYPPHLRRPVLR